MKILILEKLQEKQVEENDANMIDDECRKLLKNYYDGKISYDDANRMLHEYKLIKYANIFKIDQYIEQVNRHNEGVLTFNRAEEFYKLGNYANAYLNYSQVKENHEKYMDAKLKKEECYNKYFIPIYDTIRSLYDNGEYERATELLNANSMYVGSDNVYIDLSRKCKAQMKLIEFEKNVKSIYDEGGCIQAISHLNYYLSNETDYHDLALELHNKYAQEYKEIVITEFNNLYNKGDYDNALMKLSAALILLQKDEELSLLYNKPGLYSNIIDITNSSFNWVDLGNCEAASFGFEAYNRFFVRVETVHISCLHHDEQGKPFIYDVEIDMYASDPGSPISKCSFYVMTHLTDSGFNKKECSGKIALKSIEFIDNPVLKVWENPEYEKWLRNNMV